MKQPILSTILWPSRCVYQQRCRRRARASERETGRAKETENIDSTSPRELCRPPLGSITPRRIHPLLSVTPLPLGSHGNRDDDSSVRFLNPTSSRSQKSNPPPPHRQADIFFLLFFTFLSLLCFLLCKQLACYVSCSV